MTVSENTDRVVRHCPKCGSVRVHRSRRRGPIEPLLVALGASICRCHDCRARQAWFGLSPFPIGNRDPEAGPWAGIFVIASGLVVSLVLIWLMLTRFSQIAG